MGDTEFDPEKSMQQNVQGWAVGMGVKIKQNRKSIDALDEVAKEFLKLKTTIENLELKELKTKFFEFRQEVQTAQAIAASKAKTTAAITALVTSIVTGVIVALVISFLS